MLMAEMAVPVSEAVRIGRVSTYLSTAVMFTHMPMMILKVMRPGIGGGTGSASGTSGRGGNIIVNGGYVKAVGNGSGYGIGNGGNKTPYGAITINGGSVDATLGTTPNNDPSFDAFNNSGTILQLSIISIW